MIASPDGRTAYVPIYGDSGVGKPGSDGRTMDVIDIASRKLVKTIDFGGPERPHCPMFGADGRLYVTTELSKTITVIDPKTHTIVDRIPTDQPESHMVALSRDGTRAYTSNVHVGTVSVIDVKAKKVPEVIPVSPYAQRIALSVDDKWIFTADQTQPRLAVIDAAADAVKQWVALPGMAYGTAPHARRQVPAHHRARREQGRRARPGSRCSSRRTIDVPAAPQEIVVRPDGKRGLRLLRGVLATALRPVCDRCVGARERR